MSNSNFNVSKIALGAAQGIAVSVIGNVILFYLFSAIGWFSDKIIIPNANAPLTVFPVIMASIVPLVFAALLFLALVRFTAKPVQIFGIIALLFLLISFAGPFSIPNVPITMAIGLNLMHLVSGVASYWSLSKSVA
jgi:hypothetical protein